MPIRPYSMKLNDIVGSVRRAFRYASYDWTREMPKRKRILTWVSILSQGYVLYVAAMWALVGVGMLPKKLLGYVGVLPTRPLAYLLVWLIYMISLWVMN